VSTPVAVNLEILRERDRKTAATLREIDSHLQRLQRAKADREAALARIRAMLALSEVPAAPECDED
jgi:hypothetical protein